jgi:hypothetical protein
MRFQPYTAGMSAVETFEVTHLADAQEDSWLVEATDPNDALEEAVRLASDAPGMYSVWDPQDPMGMPLVEREISER